MDRSLRWTKSASRLVSILWTTAVVIASLNAIAHTARVLRHPPESRFALAADHAAAWLRQDPPPGRRFLVVLPRRCGPDDEFEFRLKHHLYPVRPTIAYMPAQDQARRYPCVIAITDAQPAITALGRVVATDGNVSRVEMRPSALGKGR